jgi:DNA-binding transcriptional MerR regulator
MAPSWRIGEVAERTGLTRRTLRHYDDLGLLVPAERSWGNYRLYSSDDLLRLLQIQNLKALGLSLDEIATALDDPSMDAAAALAGHLTHLEARIAAEQRLAARLRRLAEAAEPSWDDVMDAIALSRLQTHGDPMVRLRAALAPSARSAVELVEALLAETDPAVQETLVWALAQRPDADDAALGALETATATQRGLLLRALAKTGSSVAGTVLIAALDDADGGVARAAADALGRLGEPDAAQPLADRLGRGTIPDDVLLDALVGLGDAAASALIAALGSAPPAGRATAADALARIATQLDPDAVASAVAALGEVIRAEQSELRVAAAMALAEFGDPGRAILAEQAASLAPQDPRLGILLRRLLSPSGTSPTGASSS